MSIIQKQNHDWSKVGVYEFQTSEKQRRNPKRTHYSSIPQSKESIAEKNGDMNKTRKRAMSKNVPREICDSSICI